MQWAMLSLTAVATVFCLWKWWDLFNVDRADMAEGFPLKQGLKRIMFPYILVCSYFSQVMILTYGSENLSSRYLYIFLPTILGGFFTFALTAITGGESPAAPTCRPERPGNFETTEIREVPIP